jgi:3'(2'), 5'-bisphosphate nucleotidase
MPITLKDSQIEKIIDIVLAAAARVLRVYNSPDIESVSKQDLSPLTLADTYSQDILFNGLKEEFAEVPVVSEEDTRAAFSERKNWEYFWLIDPLDGTKEFIQKNGEFTINVALIRNGKPVFGVIALPALELLYFAHMGKGAFRRKAGGTTEAIRAKPGLGDTIVVARSRSHSSPEEERLINYLGPSRVISAGSSLKFCYVAEGKADVYIRCGPTMEWDTAAGQAISECAGAGVFTFEGRPLVYNKESLTNEGFVCTASPRDILAKCIRQKS